jgi:hypothetical protein
MVNLPAFCRDSVLPEIPTKATAEYEPTGLLIAAQSADRRFQELWKARLGFIPLANVQRKHWAAIKALNKRVALSIDNGEYGDLRPVAELLARLSESISRFLEEPAAWHGPSDMAYRFRSSAPSYDPGSRRPKPQRIEKALKEAAKATWA